MNANAMQLAGLQGQIDALRRTQIPPIAGRQGARLGSGIGAGISNSARSGWATNNTWEGLEWDSSTLKGDQSIASGGTSGLTIRQTGTYLVVANIGMEATNNDADCYTAILLNGSPTTWRNIGWAVGHNAAETAYFGGGNVSGVLDLEVGDVVGAGLNLQNSGAAATLTTPAAESSLSVVRIA